MGLKKILKIAKPSWYLLRFPGGLVVKNPANAGIAGSVSGLGGSPGEGNGNPLQYSYLASHGQKSLADCSPCGRRVRHDLATEHNVVLNHIMYYSKHFMYLNWFYPYNNPMK